MKVVVVTRGAEPAPELAPRPKGATAREVGSPVQLPMLGILCRKCLAQSPPCIPRLSEVNPCHGPHA